MYTIALTHAGMLSWDVRGEIVVRSPPALATFHVAPNRLPDDAAFARFDKSEQMDHMRA
jgi:hypothetical protein